MFYHDDLVFYNNDGYRPRQSSDTLGNKIFSGMVSNSIQGIPPRWHWSEKEEILSYLPYIQARKMSSLLTLQSLCVEYGPSLSLDQQLCWISESKIFPFTFVLCLTLHPLGFWRYDNKCQGSSYRDWSIIYLLKWAKIFRLVLTKKVYQLMCWRY